MSQHTYDDEFAAPHEVITLGGLLLPSGRVAACDPYFCASATPFARRVSPGGYEVQLRRVRSEEWGRRIALARIVFRPGARARAFEPAATEGGVGAYFVDSGVGSFMDETTRQAFAELLANYYRANPRGNYYTDVLAAEFKRSADDPDDPGDIGRWNMHNLPGSGLNVAMFGSGLGDGSYESFWGVGEDGEATSLVTDFKIL